jgi:hypothetical protein
MSAITPTPTGNGAARPKRKCLMTTALWRKRRVGRAPQHELPAPDAFDAPEREPDRIYQLPAGIK